MGAGLQSCHARRVTAVGRLARSTRDKGPGCTVSCSCGKSVRCCGQIGCFIGAVDPFATPDSCGVVTADTAGCCLFPQVALSGHHHDRFELDLRAEKTADVRATRCEIAADPPYRPCIPWPQRPHRPRYEICAVLLSATVILDHRSRPRVGCQTSQNKARATAVALSAGHLTFHI